MKMLFRTSRIQSPSMTPDPRIATTSGIDAGAPRTRPAAGVLAALVGMLLCAPASPALALDDQTLAATVGQRLHGDRSGACMAVAVVEKAIARAIVCADPDSDRALTRETVFEIGSVSKTLAGALAAAMQAQGLLDLDDPVAQHLPEDSVVPTYDGQPITLRHLLAHTSGLPSLPQGLVDPDPANPYRAIDGRALLDALAKVRLDAVPGTRWGYSNFGSMVLSYALSHRGGRPFDELLQTHLFEALGMDTAHAGEAPAGTKLAMGHIPGGHPVPAWDFDRQLAGVGGVSASLDDMVIWVGAQLGAGAGTLADVIHASQAQISDVGRPMAMGWMLAPLNGRRIHVHEGGTGGFSSFVAFDRTRGRGVVILADTSMTMLGGLASLGLHLLDDRVPLGPPRRAVEPDPMLVEDLVGRHVLPDGTEVELRKGERGLVMRTSGQPELALGFDDAGDFYPLAPVYALLRPKRTPEGVTFSWSRFGGQQTARRLDPPARPDAAPPGPLDLGQYEGTFRIAPPFAITVSVRDGVLHAQGTGQKPLPITAVAPDVFVQELVGAEFQFERDASGRVVALVLEQKGRRSRGRRE